MMTLMGPLVFPIEQRNYNKIELIKLISLKIFNLVLGPALVLYFQSNQVRMTSILYTFFGTLFDTIDT